MGKLVLDPEVQKKLKSITEPIELCDDKGQSFGHFLPTGAFDELFYAALAKESPHSAEELKRRHRETGGRPLKEIWKSLGRV